MLNIWHIIVVAKKSYILKSKLCAGFDNRNEKLFSDLNKLCIADNKKKHKEKKIQHFAS